jgi:predicted secreted protein|tara:strand:- start:531 stop:785 length:255 start_codon:yes stop_codon:yes gene_type:complete
VGITGSIIVYVLIWWIIFFSVLPIGIQSNKEKFQEKIEGIDPGAPNNPKIGKKFLITTILTSIIFLLIYYLVKFNFLNLREYLQ